MKTHPRPGVATYPREGTETTFAALIFSTYLPLQLIPARGRKPNSLFIDDEAFRLQLIPARGRKRVFRNRLHIGWALQLIPARGRKHSKHSIMGINSTLQLIPARGRKRCLTPIKSTSHMLLQLIPARGRKPGANVVHFRGQNSCNLSPRGDGNAQGVRVLAVPSRCNLSPRGDGNFLLQKGVLGGKAFLLQLIPARGQKPLVIKGQNRI